ncbi:MAG: hypothetical protein AB7L13_03690 [Acidimicrobiia bacterium]
MSSPQSRPGRRPGGRRSTIFAVASLVLGLALVAAVVRLSSSGKVEVRLGADTYNAGKAVNLARSIDRDGPALYQDLLIGGRRDLMVNHVGADEFAGWYAFEARVPGSDRTCTLVWTSSKEFVDPCTGTRYPATGEGLPQYPVEVTDNGRVVVDLTPGGIPGGGTTTTPAPTTTQAPKSTIPVIGAPSSTAAS